MPIDLALLRYLPLVRTATGWVAVRLGRPQLRLAVSSLPPWALQTPVSVARGLIAAVGDGIQNYYRLSVKNIGRSQAQACRVVLTEVWFVERGVWRRYQKWQPVALIWSGRLGESKINISPDEEVFCDIGHVPSNYIQNNVIRATDLHALIRDQPSPRERALFMLDLTPVLLSQPNALQRGHYLLRVSVFSDNARTERVVIDLRFPGDFPTLFDAHRTAPLAGVELALRPKVPNETELDDAPVSIDARDDDGMALE